MSGLSTQARANLNQGGVWHATVDVVLDGTLAASTSDGLAVTGGKVSVSGTRNYRRVLRGLEIVDPAGSEQLRTLLSHRSGAMIAPSVRWGNDQTFYPLGLFRPTRLDSTETASGVVHVLSGNDQAWLVDRAGFDTAITIDEDTDVTDAIVAVVNGVLAKPVETLAGRVGISVERTTWLPGQKPWSDAVVTLAQAAGVQAYFDTAGRLVVRPIPTTSTTTAPDWTYESELLDPRVEEDASTWGNGVTVTASADWLLFPVSATVWDDDPNSPTYYLGPTGKHHINVDNPAVSSVAAATVAARAELERLKGADTPLAWSQVPNPAHEAFDVIDARRPALGVNHRMVLDEFEIPLKPGPATGKARLIGNTA